MIDAKSAGAEVLRIQQADATQSYAEDILRLQVRPMQFSIMTRILRYERLMVG